MWLVDSGSGVYILIYYINYLGTYALYCESEVNVGVAIGYVIRGKWSTD